VEVVDVLGGNTLASAASKAPVCRKKGALNPTGLNLELTSDVAETLQASSLHPSTLQSEVRAMTDQAATTMRASENSMISSSPRVLHVPNFLYPYFETTMYRHIAAGHAEPTQTLSASENILLTLPRFTIRPVLPQF
jgi:hypothetical protein